MTFDKAVYGGASLIRVEGRIDMSNSDTFKDSLMEVIGAADAAIIVDMSGVDYISSAGLRSLMIGLRAAKAEGKAFGVAALRPLVLEIFTISRFNLVFSIYNSVREALSAMAPDGLESFIAS